MSMHRDLLRAGSAPKDEFRKSPVHTCKGSYSAALYLDHCQGWMIHLRF